MSKLYLQEKTHIIGMHPNRRNCARVIVNYARAIAESDTQHPFRNIGVWELVGMTGRWAQTLGLYEFENGWSDMTDMIVHTMKTPSAELASTYDAIESYRSGGDDEILTPLEGSPDLAAIDRLDTDAPLLVHDVMQVDPGRENDYGALVMAELKPICDAYDRRLIGLFRGALTDGLVIAYWATSLGAYARMQASSEWRQWNRHAIGNRRSWRQELWTATPGSRFSDSTFDYGERDIRQTDEPVGIIRDGLPD